MKRSLTNHRTFHGEDRVWGCLSLGLFSLLVTLLLLSCATPIRIGSEFVPTDRVVASTTRAVVPSVTRATIPSPTGAVVPSSTSIVIPSATRAVIASPARPVESPTATPGPVQTPDRAASAEASGSPPPMTHTPAAGNAAVYTYRIVNVFPHDRTASTQGLVFEEGALYEGTGLWGHSTLRRVDLESGEILQLKALPAQYYGEGIAVWGTEIIQLTYKSGVGFVYDQGSFELIGSFRYATEGWGLTHDGERLIMSDGTATLHFWDPETLQELDQVQVHYEGSPVYSLNELEYIEGQVYANIYQTDLIAIIEPRTGQVTGWIDLSGLLATEDCDQSCGVLNGIAFDAERERLFVTGKLWPKLFEIELVPAQ